MKAKIIKTGEIVDVYHEPQHGQISNIYKESVFVNGRMWQENELEFIDSKNVDLEKEIDDYVNAHFSECDDGVLISDTNSMELTLLDITPLAKHFFELGMSVSNKAQKGEGYYAR